MNDLLSVQELIFDSVTTANEKGWWDKTPTSDEILNVIPEKIALMHAELSEALEEYRRSRNVYETNYEGEKPVGFLSEMADVYIRVADLLGKLGAGQMFEEVLRKKLAYNKTRPYRHGGKCC